MIPFRCPDAFTNPSEPDYQTYFAPLVADLFLYCYERDFTDSLNYKKQADVIGAFYFTSRYLDDPLNIDSPYFEGMRNQILYT